MADLRYIGARYVPRFMGTYDSTQVYEGLDVVDDGNDVLYISKQPVPINTPPTNSTYWAEYGRIQDFQDQIDAINNEIADMKNGTVTGSLQNQITANDNEIADMKDGTVTGSLQAQINANDDDIADMKDGSVTGSLQNQINTINNSLDWTELLPFTNDASRTAQLPNAAREILVVVASNDGANYYPELSSVYPVALAKAKSCRVIVSNTARNQWFSVVAHIDSSNVLTLQANTSYGAVYYR